ncbi:MAG: hypothetical protein KME01_01375 [Chroococcus sp. CMT-3BRIN-NPC107]|jgi:hypothetical protein|nr:hypothetical protein [Chroococcus sp. CMT-3BRIN-NPC107]
MNDWHNFFNHVDDNLATSTYRIFDKQSKAEILDWFSREDIAKEQKEDFIQALVDFKDDCGDFYHYRAYLLAAEALNCFKDCSRGDAIALQILKWSHNFFRQDKQDWQIVPQPLVEAARLTLETTDRQRVIAAFVHLIHTTESRSILRIAAEKLGKLDPGNKSAIAALVLLLQVTKDESLLWDITCSLMKIDPDNSVGISTLFKVIQSSADESSDLDKNCYTVGYAAEALRKIDLDQIGINALVRLMQTTANRNAVEFVIEELIIMAKDNQTVIAALTEFLQINQGDRICINVANALGQIDKGNVNEIATLVKTIETTADIFTLEQAAGYLWEIAPINIDAISALTERLATTQDEYFCWRVAANLVQFDPTNELAIATLSQTVQSNPFTSYRLQAIDSLLSINPSNQLALDTLFELIQYLSKSPPAPRGDNHNAWYATKILLRVDPSYQLTIAALVNLLKTIKNDSNLSMAIRDLGDFAVGNKDAIAALTKFIDSIKDNRLLFLAACSLDKIDPGNQKALFTLISSKILMNGMKRSFMVQTMGDCVVIFSF